MSFTCTLFCLFADELIRQVTINCTERGKLLVRVRDELRLTRETYQTLYESSIAFGIRRSLQGEKTKMEMHASVRRRCSNVVL